MRKVYVLKFYLKPPIARLGFPPLLIKYDYNDLFSAKDTARKISLLSNVVNNKAYVYHAGKKPRLMCVYINGQCERKDYK